MAQDFTEFLNELFADSTCGFSIGSSGALAEFPASKDTRVTSTRSVFSATVSQGAIAIKPDPNMRWLAYETLSRNSSHWNCELIAHADKTALYSSKRNTLTEVGLDKNSLKVPSDKEVIFDLGLGLDNADFCVRTSDSTLKNILRKYLGTNIAIEEHPIIETLIKASPTRIVCNAFGRIEVYQPINRKETPDGPHTHFLPALLRRAHRNHRFLPKGRIPIFFVHPLDPLSSTPNQAETLDKHLYEKFEDILIRFGWPTYNHSKRQTINQLIAGSKPDAICWSKDSLARAGQKIAFRQFIHL